VSDLKIAFVGDLSLTGVYYEQISNDQEIFSDSILDELKSTDHCVCNFEGPATQSTQSNEEIPIKSPLNSIKYLSKRSISIFNLANNHIFDYGRVGLSETINEINDKRLLYFGAGNNINEASTPVYLKKNNTRVAIIGIADYTKRSAKKNANGYFSTRNFIRLKKIVNRAAIETDWVIINFHGGEEYTVYPSPAKKRLMKNLAKLKSVDIIIGHHSHTFQGIEKIHDTMIFHSLGNFVFDFKTHDYYDFTNESAILNINFNKENFTYTLIPTRINKTKRQIEKGELSFIKHVQRISDFSDHRDKWKKDAYRRIFNPKEKSTGPLIEEDRLYKQKAIKWFFNARFYRLAWRILFNKYSRSIYLNAILHKFLKQS